ncbi:hypothetical protein [Zoogloea sp.]|uniref:hypothetical protein n=1 Tax=Zoogloea sp. TaxID=49181 RepID=UPI001AC30E4F|nr:hypothetical protein [Zoogloea sp.]MBN8283393.1 hypothetical protein [Zoogloea sp.]
MADRRYVTLSPLRRDGNKFATGTPVALPEAEGTKLVAVGTLAEQAGALPSMPPGPAVPVMASPSGSGIGLLSGGAVVGVQSGDVVLQEIPLTHSLINPDGSVHNYTRTGVSSMIDCYGVIRYINRSNDPGFWGARRVENLIQAPDRSIGMSKTARVTQVLEAEMLSPNGQRKSVYRCDCTNTGTTELWRTNSATYDRRQLTFSEWYMGDGSTEFILKFVRGSDSAVLESRTFTPPAGKFFRFGVFGTPTNTTSTFRFELHGPINSFSYWCADPQLEKTQNQSGAPNDYVSRGYAGDVWPYQGCNVDGTQCFDTYNSWTIDATTGLCVEGFPKVQIPSEQLQCIDTHPSHINRLRYTADPGAGITAGAITATNVTAGAYADSPYLGGGALQKLVETAVNAEHKIDEPWFGTIPSDNDSITYCMFVKRDRDYCYLYIFDKSGTERRAYFDLKKLVMTSIVNAPVALNPVDGQNYNAYMAECDYLPGTDLIWVSLTVPTASGASTLRGGIGVCAAANTPSFAGDTSRGLWVAARSFQRAQQRILYVGDVGDGVTGGQTAPSAGDAKSWFSQTDLVVGNGITQQCVVTFNGKSVCMTLKGWDGVLYCKIDNDHRFGMCRRPGPFGGGVVEDVIAGVTSDFYWGRTIYNGDGSIKQEVFSVANVDNPVRAFQPQTWQYSLAKEAVEGGTGNMRLSVGRVAGAVDSNGKNIVDVMPNGAVFYLGSTGNSTPLTQKRVGRIKIVGKARTYPEMLAVSAAA